jgi:RyR domain
LRTSPEFSSHTLEALAKAIHENYRRSQSGRLTDADPAMAPWDELPECLQTSNRTQAADIARKLRTIGWEIVPDDDVDAEPVLLTEVDIEQLAELEHDRWVRQRQADGWSQGAVRDIPKKVTPYLVPWSELPEEARDRDREPARAIPTLLQKIGAAGRRTSRG